MPLLLVFSIIPRATNEISSYIRRPLSCWRRENLPPSNEAISSSLMFKLHSRRDWSLLASPNEGFFMFPGLDAYTIIHPLPGSECTDTRTLPAATFIGFCGYSLQAESGAHRFTQSSEGLTTLPMCSVLGSTFVRLEPSDFP